MSLSPQVIIVFIAAAVSFGTAGFTYLRQDVAARRTFIWLMVAMGFWSLLSGLHTLAPTQVLKVMVAKAQYVAISSVPLLWLLVAHQVAGLPSLRRRHLTALATIPLLTVAAAWTNDWHGWLWAQITSSGSTLVYHHGPWFWVAVAYNYALLLTAHVLLIRALRSTPDTFHPQLWVMIGAVCLPWFGNVLYLTRVIPIPGLDPTPLTFILCGVLFSWALTNFRFLDLVPIARSVLLDHMEDGVLVIDRAQRLVDANAAARRLANLTVIGQPLHLAVPPLSAPVAESQERGESVLVEPFGPTGTSIEVRVTPLGHPGEAVAGWLVILRDITTQQSLLREVRAEHQFSLQVQQQLEAANAQLRELARTDGLTGLRNRSAFDELLAEEVAGAPDTQAPLSLLLLDIDQFKTYNDTFGHVAGDGVLRAVGRIFQEQSRQRDVVARYGGEEFAIILPNTDEPESLLVAERIRRSVERTAWPARGVTVSIGVATRCEPWTAEQLIELADGALYHAKAHGRNQVTHACQIRREPDQRQD